MTLHADSVSTLRQWDAPNDDQAALRDAYLTHLEAHADGLTRDCHPDHITASAIVVSVDREHVLLNLHAKYQIWVQFGGHCEPDDTSLAEAALREAVEESGISRLRLISAQPLQLSSHEVRCGPVRPSHHLDVRYVAEADGDEAPVVSDESSDLCWFAVSALPEVDEPLRELIEWACFGPADGSGARR